MENITKMLGWHWSELCKYVLRIYLCWQSYLWPKKKTIVSVSVWVMKMPCLLSLAFITKAKETRDYGISTLYLFYFLRKISQLCQKLSIIYFHLFFFSSWYLAYKNNHLVEFSKKKMFCLDTNQSNH